MALLSEQTKPADQAVDVNDVETACAVFALELGLLEEVPSTEGAYPFTMKTTYSSGSEATDD